MTKNIRDLRRELHQFPELSGEETQTAARIVSFAEKFNPSHIIAGIGGSGLAIIFDFPEEGPVVIIRCELDALPIEEPNNFSHRSRVAGVSHKCGHDGHMAIVAGLMPWIEERCFNAGKIVLLFQPAEETGKGALKVINHPEFQNIKPDYVFALHNLPGEEMHSIIIVNSSFSATVESFIISLTGKVSHASEPENGINPAMAISEMIVKFSELNHPNETDTDFSILTPVHINMGSINYGISAAEGRLHYTIRTWDEVSMENLRKEIQIIINSVCSRHNLLSSLEWLEYFPATVNDPRCNNYIKNAVLKNHLKIRERPYPFKFGEDFGWFSKEFRSAMFGLGAGVGTPALHHADYDFPDEILETGIKMLGAIIEQVLE